MTSKGRKSNFDLPTLDDLFSTQQERDEAKLDKIRDIPISEIDDFPNHPFQVRDDEDMLQLVESIKEHGVMTPAVLRVKDDGRFEVVAGHRRKRACELAGLDTLRSEVKHLTRDEATVYMVESNFQRSTILPSEKAFAYKMRMDALNRQGERSDLTSRPLGEKLSVTTLSNDVGDSERQIHRYIRLTYLIPELLQLVDEGKMKMRPAVELSYLNTDFQRDVLENVELNDCTPSHAQTIRMRRLYEEHSLTPEVIADIMCEQKPNQRERMVFNGERMRKLLPHDLPMNKTEDYICEAITFYRKHNREHEQSRKSNRDAR
ncbi:ParB/RepB/Spo0J family partition protein [uncultured Ruminococcus sp.]|uniref:ParB/RepB/Spo0J family partition protein n=1 Tax=uncultured Ruminococcus sp. TaxID=165186 RepID=UPI0029309074|nr:ParB/RepB/Spo0J family partition protein [uncultured Ruminococcus sp.]